MSGISLSSISNSSDVAVGIERKENAFQVESNSKDSIDITFQDPKTKIHKSSKIYKSSNSKGYTDADGNLLSRENPRYDKLELYYPLSEDTKDKSGYSKDGKGHSIKPGMPGYKGCSTYFPGPFNSLSFDGTDDYVSIANPSTDLSGNLTISMWFLSSVSSWADTLISKDYDGEFDINYTTSVGGFRFHQGASNNSNYYYYDTSYSISPNIWYHLVYTRKGSGTNWTIKIYINGILIDTPSVNTTNGGGVANTPPQTTSNILIGAQNYDGSAVSTWQGQISDVRIYNTAITADQVSDIYNYGTILGHEVAHYKIEKTMGINLIDSSGNGYTGTLTNGPTYSDGPYDSSLVTENGAYIFGEKDSTVSVWLYTTYSDDKQVIFSNNGNDQLFEFGIDKMSHETTYKKLFLKTKNTADNTTGYFLITETDFEPNRWYFLTIVRKDNNGYIYVDGIRCSTFNRSLNNMPKPVAHYKLDETSGSTAIDSSGNGNDGTINGATVNQIGYNGSVGAYSFDGSNDYISIPNPSTDLSGNLTISMWFKRDTSATGQTLISKDQKEFELYFHSSALRLYYGDTSLNGPVSSTFLAEQWYHLVVTRIGSTGSWTIKFYVNGLFSTESTTSTDPDLTTRDIYIAAENNNGSVATEFDGQISDVRIYDQVLTSDQVNELYQERSSVYNFEEKTNLKLHLPLNHSLKDVSGNGYNGSFFGGNPSYVENYKGAQNGALNFDGSNDYVTNGSIVSNDLTSFFGRDAFTISLWINPDSVVGSSITIPISLGGKIVFNYGHSSSTYQKSWDINDGSGNPAKYTSTFVINTWYHLVAVFKKNDSGATNGYLKAYLNGILEATHNSVDQATTPTSDLFIGSHDSSNYRFNGQISDVRIYNRALTNIEVKRLYQSTLRVDEYAPGTLINKGNLGSTNTPISIGKSISDKFHYRGYLQELKIFNCALSSVEIAELYHNYAFDKYHEPLENDNMLMRNEDLLPNSRNLLAHYKFDGNGNDETGNYNLTSVNSPEYKKYGVFDQSALINSKIVAVGWGYNDQGQLGIGNTNNIGDGSNEMGNSLIFANLGSNKTPVQIVSGNKHTVCILNDGSVKCWGDNSSGQLGYGNTTDKISPDSSSINLGTGRTAIQIAAGELHTCTILDDGSVKCWGEAQYGQLGYGNTTDKTSPDSSSIDLGTGRTATQITCGSNHTCVILDDGTIKCWGYNNGGQLGLGDTNNRGDGSSEMGDNLPIVDLGTGRTAIQISAGHSHTCVILDDGSVKCWGNNIDGQLGYGNTNHRGDGSNEMGDDLLPVDLGTGRTAVQISCGNNHTSVILDNGSVKCWGENIYGQLGYGDTNERGDEINEMGDNLPTVNLGTDRTAIQISAGQYHTCVLLDDGNIKCWGRNNYGQLGIESTTQSNSPTSNLSLGTNLIKCIQISSFGDHNFIIGQYKGVGTSTLSIANQQYYTLPSTLTNIQSFSGWIKIDNISSGNLPIIYFNSNNYLYIDTSNNSLYFESNSSDGTQQNLYVNGNLVAVSNTGGDITNSANSITASFNKNNKKITIDSQLQPVAHYKFDEGAGTTALDSSGNGYNGTLTGGPVYTSNQNDIYGKAIDFDGTDDYISISNPSTSLTGNLTLSIWIKRDDTSESGKTLISKYFAREFGLAFWDRLVFYNGTTSSGGNYYYYDGPDTNTFLANTWYHIVVTRSGSGTSWTVKFYINGILNITDSTPVRNGGGSGNNTPQSSTLDINIGARNNNGSPANYFNGQMSDIRIYDSALNATQVKQIYNNTLLSTNVTLTKDQLIYISDAVDSNNNGFKNITYSQNNKASNYETEITTNEYIDDEINDKISVQLGRIEPEKWYHIVLNTTFNNSTSSTSYFGYDGTNYFSGCMDDFRLYNKNLTPDEVKHLYNRQLSGNNLALHLPLTENTNNNIKDKSIYKHVTTNHGVESGDIGPVGGSIKFNPFGVLSFDGSNDYISIPHNISLDMSSSNSVTVSVWVNVTNFTSDYRAIFSAYNNKSGNITSYRLMISNSGYPYFTQHTSGAYAVSSDAIDLNKWYHILGTINDSSRKIYVNGVLKGTNTTTEALTSVEDVTDSIKIGKSEASDGDMFYGLLSDFRIYNTELTAEQVKDIYFNQTILGTEVLHYKFNEKMGTTAFDSSGNENNGVLTNGPTYYLSNPYRNYAMKFDGSNDYVSIANPSHDLSKNLTISMWFNRDSTSESGQTLISKDGDYDFELYIKESIKFYHGDSHVVGMNTSTFLAHKWYHIVVTREGSTGSWTIKFYINGMFNIQANTSTNPVLSTKNIYIGAENNNGSVATEFDGQISDIRIYDYPLTSEEIYKIYKTGEVFGTEKLHYTFNQAGGDQVLDQSGNGHHGTATNGPTYQKVENPNLGSYLTVDSAERFNNSNGYLYPMYDISSKSHSFFCWMKLDENYTSGKNNNCIFSKVLNKNYVDMALSLNNGKLEFETKFNDNIDSSIIELYPTFLPNQWYHIGYSIDFTESPTESINTKKIGIFKFYINGIMHTKYVSSDKRYTSSKNISIRTHNINNFHSSKLYIGKSGDSSLSTFNDSIFKGCLSDIRFYNTEITPMQVRELFFNRNDGTIVNTELEGTKSNQLLFEKFDGTDILIGHWSLSSTNSRIIFDKSKDSTHNNNNGLLDSGISSIRYAGITGTIPLFDGSSNDQMKINCSAAITGIKSISFWIKPKSVAQKTLLFLKDDSTDTFIEINGSAQINTSNISSPTTYVNTSTTITTLVVDKWYHIIITTGTGITTDTAIYVASKVSSDYYNGFIDDIRFYNLELTTQQINNLYYQQSTPDLPYNNELIGKWLLNGNYLDSSGNNNNGTLIGNEEFITGYNNNLAFKSNANNSTISVSNNYTTLRSISFWVYLEKLNQTILTTSSGLYLKIESTGKINANGITNPSIYINGVKNSISTTTGDYEVSLNEWEHITVTKSAVITGNAIVFGDNSFKGAIQNVEFYNTQITDAQVKDIYKYGTYNDLVLHYKFDEGIGNTALDNSRNNYDGTIVSATYTSNYLEEKNKALIFNGTSNYLINSDIVKSGDTNFFGNTKWSISLWFKANNGLDGTPSDEVIINLGGSIILNWDHNTSGYRGAWRVQQSSSWKLAQYSGSPTNNTWYHTVATFDSSIGLKAYLNGTHNVDASSSNATIDTPNTNLLIGSRTITAHFFAGSVADVRIYNYVLSANQITDLYYQNKSHNINNLGYDNQYLTFSQKDIRNNNIINDETHIKRDNLALYYKFKDLSISDVKDYGNTLKPESQSYTYNSGIFKSNTTTTTITESLLTNGKDGLNNNALKLDGTDDNVTIANTISFTAGGTISLWIQANYINENILQLTSDDDVYLQLTTDLKLKMTFDATTTDIYLYINGKVDGYLSSGTILTSNNSIDPLIWNHIGVSFNNYNSGGTLSANQIKLGLIGDTISTTTVFNGAFDELKIYTTQLTNDEMYQLYFDKKSSPIVHLPMQETSGSSLCNIGTSNIDVKKFPKFSTTQTQTLVPTSGDTNDVFGSAIDLNDDFIVVGDYNEDSNNKGTVYVYNNNGNNNWGSSNNENDRLRATSRVNNALFGTSVAISGNTIIVGSPGEDVSAGSTADDTGCVYVFTYSGSAWSQSQRLTASDAAAGDKFGTSVAISGNTFIVGSPNENTEAGQVYVFNYDGSTWSQNSILAASSRVTNAYFGNNISIFNNQIFVSAYGEDETAGSSADNTGCVYVFNYDGISWYQSQRLIASDKLAGDKFGSSLCVSNNILLIGAPEENTEQGQVYIFNYDNSAKTWSQDTSNILQAASRATNDYFGYSVGFSNNKIIVGAYKTGTNKGKIYEFYYNNSTKYIGPIIDGDADNDLFGQTLKIHNDKLIVGVPADNGGEGAVYFYKADNTITAPSTDINPSFNKNCLNFNGTTDFFELRTPVNVIRSVSFWINPSAVGNRILYYISSTIKIEINSSNQINAYGFTSPFIYINNKSETVSNSGSNNTGGTALTTNNWYHIVIFSSTAVASVVNNSYIGHNNSDTTSILFQGQMSDFRVYDCQLSKPEIHKLYNYSNIYKSINY